MKNSAITLDSVSKKYPIYDNPFQKLREAVGGGRKRYHREFWALRDISLEITTGVTLGILGQNGSGKTTLLQILARIIHPTAGTVTVRGRVSTILELGAGFNPDFTGRENALLSGLILGLSPSRIQDKMKEIGDFAEIGDFIDQPVKTYSSGMYVRLAFAVAVTLNPDILLIDEVLAVGDAYFQHKCARKIREFQEAGKTIVYVTHNIESVRNICHQAMILDYSRILARGEPGEIADQYLALIDGREQSGRDGSDGRQTGTKPPPGDNLPDYDRYGAREAEIMKIEILDKEGESRNTFSSGEEMVIKFSVTFNRDVDNFVFGNIFRNKYGLNTFGTNTLWHGLPPRNFRKGDCCTVIFRHRAGFASGTYSINTAASARIEEDTYRTLDWINNAALIRIRNPRRMEGYVSLPTEIEIEKITDV